MDPNGKDTECGLVCFPLQTDPKKPTNQSFHPTGFNANTDPAENEMKGWCTRVLVRQAKHHHFRHFRHLRLRRGHLYGRRDCHPSSHLT